MFDDKIAVKNDREFIFIRLHEITFIYSSNKYCTVHTMSGRRYVQKTSIEAIEEQKLKGMLRISETIIINTSHLASIHSENGWFSTAEMDDCNEFEISKDRLQSIMCMAESFLLVGNT